jgi:hypothetical protein
MAELQGSALINCSFIPDFIPSGTYMLFDSTNAPVGWAKTTTHNDKALRLVSGSVTAPGTGQPFSTVLSSARSLATPGTDARQTGYQLAPSPQGITLGTVTPPVTIGSVSTTPGTHTHPYSFNSGTQRSAAAPVTPRTTSSPSPGFVSQTPTGGGGQHTHGPVAGLPHSHTLTSDHNHTISESPHSHPAGFTSQSFAVNYRDIILASKT